MKKEISFFYMGIMAFFITMIFMCDALFSRHLAYMFPFVSYGGTFRWHFIKIANLKISLYWSSYIAGIVSMCSICLIRRERYKISITNSIITVILLSVLGFVGAKILFLLENRDALMQRNIQIQWGGVSFFGTVFFMPVVLPIIGKILKTDAFCYLDFCTPAGILMLACIRCGCFMRGCCHGIKIWVLGNPLIFPTQLMECTFDLFLLHYILQLEKRHKFEKGRYIIFAGIYGIIRFFLEFIRDTQKTVLGMSNGQIFSMICIIIAFFYLIIFNKNKLIRNNI